MNHSTPGLPVHHQLPEFTETHVHRVSDAIQPFHPLSSPSPPAPIPPSIRVFSNESSLHMRWPKYWSCLAPLFLWRTLNVYDWARIWTQGALHPKPVLLPLHSSWRGHGNPLQYFYLGNPMDRGAWRATVHRVGKSWTWLKRLGTHANFQFRMMVWKYNLNGLLARMFRNDSNLK